MVTFRDASLFCKNVEFGNFGLDALHSIMSNTLIHILHNCFDHKILFLFVPFLAV